MEKATPEPDRRTTKGDLEGLTAKEITVLPASVLGPIIRQAIIDGGSNPPDDRTIKQAIDAVRRGHWTPGLPRNKTIDIKDLFGG